MTAGEFVYLIRADKSQLNTTLDSSEKDVKGWGNKISTWTIAKGQMIGQFATKAIMKVTDITSSVLKNTINAYGKFEQLQGGAELMFGSSYKKIMDKAAKAYSTVQMSANAYLEAVNGYAVGLKTSLGGDEKAAADLADKIITAQADVVAATGKSREAVQNAFAGVMRGNFMMLDNLGLGIKGSKEGMEDVIKSVNEWHQANKRATKYEIGNLADMENALVDYIEMQGMAGYAGKEAADTIEGTMASTKAAWENLLVAFGSGKDVKTATKNLADSAKKLLKNILPVAKNTIQSIGDFVVEMIPEVGKWLSELSAELKKSDNPIVTFIGDGIEFVQNQLRGVSDLVNDFEGTVERLKGSDDPVKQFIGQSLSDAKAILDWIIDNQNTVKKALEVMGGGFLGWKISTTVMDAINFVKKYLPGGGGNGGTPTMPTDTGTPTIPTNPTTPTTPTTPTSPTTPTTPPTTVPTTTPKTGGGLLDKIKSGLGALGAKAGDALIAAAPAAYLALYAGIATVAFGATENAKQLMKEAAKAGEESKKEYAEKSAEFKDSQFFDTWNQLKTYYSTTGTGQDKNGLNDFVTHYFDWFNDNVEDKALDAMVENMKDYDKFHDVMNDIYSGIINGQGADFSESEAREKLLSSIDDAITALEEAMAQEPAEIDVKPDVDIGALEDQLNKPFTINVTPNVTFPWNKHAKGLWSVPYDNYPALLHRNEKVLTASQARQGVGSEDYGDIAETIGMEIRNALNDLAFYLNGNKVGDAMTKKIDKNIRARTYSVQRAMGG